MKDFMQQELAIGDVVIVNDKKYSNLELGHIIAFTPTMARVKVYGKDKRWEENGQLCHSYQIHRIDQELATAYVLKHGLK